MLYRSTIYTSLTVSIGTYIMRISQNCSFLKGKHVKDLNNIIQTQFLVGNTLIDVNILQL